MREPFAETREIGIVVCGVGILTIAGTDKEKKIVEEINIAQEARVKEAVREAVAERDARTAELERVLAIAENSILECRGGLRVCDGLLGGRLNLMGAIESAGKALAEIKSVLGEK